MDIDKRRPTSRGTGAGREQEQGNIAPKVFNCIVDETALVQGAKKSTRDGIPKWVAAGRIRLFVPLHALTQTSRLKNAKGRIASDASEALEWLDGATSKHPDFVTLQGGFDKFETWAEAEKFAQPRALFSEDDPVDDLESERDLAEHADDLKVGEGVGDNGPSFSSNESCPSGTSAASNPSVRSPSPLSPPISPPKPAAPAVSPPAASERASDLCSPSQTPRSIQPLFNYILWRVNQEINPAAALDTFVFLTDNPAIKKHAQRFGIRTKALAEIRYVISRESQDARNRHMLHQKSQPKVQVDKDSPHSRTPSGQHSRPQSRPQSRQANRDPPRSPVAQSLVAGVTVSAAASDDEDEVLFKRLPFTSNTVRQSSPASGLRVMDPDQFERGISGMQPPKIRGAGRENARAGPHRGRGRGGNGRSQGRKGNAHEVVAEPIDPDSFARPSSSRRGARGARGLWMPT